MAVKVLIQRKVKTGREENLHALVRELRSKAMHVEGFISAENVRSIDDPSIHLVISTWKNLDAWNTWFNGADRQALEAQLLPFLDEPTRIFRYQYE